MANRWGNSDGLFFGAPKSLQMVTAAVKLKDACSLEGKLHWRGTPRFPARLQLSPFTPPDRDKMVDSPALSGRGSRSLTFLPRSKHLLISRLQSPSAVILPQCPPSAPPTPWTHKSLHRLQFGEPSSEWTLERALPWPWVRTHTHRAHLTSGGGPQCLFTSRWPIAPQGPGRRGGGGRL